MGVNKKVGQTVTQAQSNIIIGGEEFFYPAITTRTLLMLSQYISTETEEFDLDKGGSVSDIIELARENDALPRVLATLILGGKRINENKPHIEQKEVEITHEIDKYTYMLGFIPRIIKTSETSLKIEDVETGTEFEYLVNRFTDDFAVSDIVTAIMKILNDGQDTAFFLQGLIFLKQVSMTNPTKETSQTVLGG